MEHIPFERTQFEKDWIVERERMAAHIANVFGISLLELGVREVEGSITIPVYLGEQNACNAAKHTACQDCEQAR